MPRPTGSLPPGTARARALHTKINADFRAKINATTPRVNSCWMSRQLEKHARGCARVPDSCEGGGVHVARGDPLGEVSVAGQPASPADHEQPVAAGTSHIPEQPATSPRVAHEPGQQPAWRDLAVGGRQERELERLRSEMAQLRLREEETGKRSLRLLLESQEGLATARVFATWRELAFGGRQERELERLRFDLMQQRLQEKVVAAKRALRLLLAFPGGPCLPTRNA